MTNEKCADICATECQLYKLEQDILKSLQIGLSLFRSKFSRNFHNFLLVLGLII